VNLPPWLIVVAVLAVTALAMLAAVMVPMPPPH
jgi:hypothetical protein